MSKFDSGKGETPPTRLIRNKETKKVDPSNATVTSDSSAAKNQGDANFRQESGSMAGGNFAATAKPAAAANAPEAKSDANKTVFFRANKGEHEGAAQSSASDKPVTAWLVVTKGAGLGCALQVSYGLHKIGRDMDQEIVLNYGDDGISREQHASIEYDTKLRKFFLSKGNNLVYLNGERVGQGGEKEISTGDEIQLTDDTTLRFVAFCDENFDWNDQ